eukprot:gb/GECG01004492.1/.p1 GENE.gb/GECG01004492.1/~~gb/GECG01004492.1/.p1  ORF type:complete len:817 (+),score=139.92 gb/GECG01004492.1/:1-2451(+)
MNNNADTIVLDLDDDDTGEEDNDVAIVMDEPTPSSAASATTSSTRECTSSRASHSDSGTRKWWVDKDAVCNTDGQKPSANPRPRRNKPTDRLVAARVTLQVQHTEQRSKKFGISYVLYGHKAGITIGRSRVLPLPRLVLGNDVELSSTHAKIFLDDSKSTPKLRIMDLGSSNGTKRGEADLIPKRSYVLQQGHDVLVGATDIHVEYAETFASFESNNSDDDNEAYTTTESNVNRGSPMRTRSSPRRSSRSPATGSRYADKPLPHASKRGAAASTDTEHTEDDEPLGGDTKKDERDKQKELKELDALISSLQEKRRELLREMKESNDEGSRKAWKPMASPAKPDRGNLNIPSSRFNQEEATTHRSLWEITGKAANKSSESGSKPKVDRHRGISKSPREEDDVAIQGTQSEWDVGEHNIDELTTDVVPGGGRGSNQETKRTYSSSSDSESSYEGHEGAGNKHIEGKNTATASEAGSSQSISQSQGDIHRLVGMFTQPSDVAVNEGEEQEEEEEEDILGEWNKEEESKEANEDKNSVISIYSDNAEEENQSPESSGSFTSARGEEDTEPQLSDSLEPPAGPSSFWRGGVFASSASTSRDLNQDFQQSSSSSDVERYKTKSPDRSETAVAHTDKGPPYDDPTRYSYVELKQLVTEYGLVARSREKMIEQLEEIWNYLQTNRAQILHSSDFRKEWLEWRRNGHASASGNKSQSSTSTKRSRAAASSRAPLPSSDDALADAYGRKKRNGFKSAITDDTYSALRNCIKRRNDLYDRMLAFEAVDVTEVVEVAKEDGINCPRDQIIDFLRNEGVTAAHKWQRKR